ncbi:uncharacterized protein [Spinacia oleracea]|uniref:Uncharacterized protein n=1 Tax=Spinacia oleracea TaxID=3562 RepID=A0ABM3QY37_SPIOL|nr:uncharacterized protein LOC130463218 [Spinacia oleracea]
MSRVGPVDLGNPDHVALLEWFRAKTTREPLHWLPNFHYITQEALLAAAGLSRIYDRAYGEAAIDPQKLGYSLEGEVLESCPPYDFKASNPRQPRLDSYKFSDHALAHLEDVRADPWSSDRPGEAVPRQTVLPELVTTSDPGPEVTVTAPVVSSASSPPSFTLPEESRRLKKRKSSEEETSQEGKSALREGSPKKKKKKKSSKVTPCPEVLEFLSQRPFLTREKVQQVVASDPSLAEAGERYLARQEKEMVLPENLRRFIPLPGQWLKSVVVLVTNDPVDQPLAKETDVPSPLKPLTPTEVFVEEITHELEQGEVDIPMVPTEGTASGEAAAAEMGEDPQTPPRVVVEISDSEAAENPTSVAEGAE